MYLKLLYILCSVTPRDSGPRQGQGRSLSGGWDSLGWLEPIPPPHAHGTVSDHLELLPAWGPPPVSQGQRPDRRGVGATTARCVTGRGAPGRSHQYSPCNEQRSRWQTIHQHHLTPVLRKVECSVDA